MTDLDTALARLMRRTVAAHADREAGLREAVAHLVSGCAGLRWDRLTESARDGWRSTAREVVAVVRENSGERP